jgi:hypothetical protein
MKNSYFLTKKPIQSTPQETVMKKSILLIGVCTLALAALAFTGCAIKCHILKTDYLALTDDELIRYQIKLKREVHKYEYQRDPGGPVRISGSVGVGVSTGRGGLPRPRTGVGVGVGVGAVGDGNPHAAAICDIYELTDRLVEVNKHMRERGLEPEL